MNVFQLKLNMTYRKNVSHWLGMIILLVLQAYSSFIFGLKENNYINQINFFPDI